MRRYTHKNFTSTSKQDLYSVSKTGGIACFQYDSGNTQVTMSDAKMKLEAKPLETMSGRVFYSVTGSTVKDSTTDSVSLNLTPQQVFELRDKLIELAAEIPYSKVPRNMV